MESQDVSEEADWEANRVAAALGINLSEQIEREAQRVAAAFGVDKWEVTWCYEWWEFIGVGYGQELVRWTIEISSACWIGSEVGPKEVEVSDRELWQHHRSSCQIVRDSDEPDVWECNPLMPFNKLMARAFYRLGFENEDVLAQLNYPLTAHEKLELRLSIPREFWPKTWIDEEGAVQAR